MKNIASAIAFISLSTLSSAAGRMSTEAPNYTIPEGATSFNQSCLTKELVQKDGGSWANESVNEEFKVTQWNLQKEFFQLRTSTQKVLYTHFYETVVDAATRTRTVANEDWVVKEGQWLLETYPSFETTSYSESRPVRSIEKHHGQEQFWDIHNYKAGEDWVSERSAKRPDLFSSPGRIVGEHTETCQSHGFGY